MLLPQGLSLDAERLIDTITEDSVNPGFVYVYLDEKEDKNIIETWKDCCIKENGRLYLSSDFIVQKFYEVIIQVCFHTLCRVLHKVNVIRQGPAVTVSVKGGPEKHVFASSSRRGIKAHQNPNINFYKNFFTADNQTDYDFEFDLVLAIPCRSWPLGQISGFIEKIHQSSTLIKSEINNYYKFGGSTTVNFHIVPKCSNNVSRYEKLEWRLSFSLLEYTIFKKLTLTEKLGQNFGCAFQALKNWKVMISHKYNKAVCSYHLKTAFFWTIEAINDQIHSNLLECNGIHPALSESQEKLEKIYLRTANIFTWLLDVFTYFIKQKNMPHYVIHNLNLLQDKVPKELETLCEQVEILNKTPVLVFKEIIKHSSTMRRKVKYFNVLDTTQFNLKLAILPQWEFRWLNARTGKEDDQLINKRHYSKKRTFIINILA